MIDIRDKDLTGTWTLRDGSIATVETKGFGFWYGKRIEVVVAWDLDGNAINKPEWDLIDKHREEKGT